MLSPLALGLAGLVAWTVLTLAPSSYGETYFHTTCVGNGLDHGSTWSDNKTWSRVEAGCGNPGRKRCEVIQIEGPENVNFVPAGVNSPCNTFSSWGERAVFARVTFDGVFGRHDH